MPSITREEIDDLESRVKALEDAISGKKPASKKKKK